MRSLSSSFLQTASSPTPPTPTTTISDFSLPTSATHSSTGPVCPGGTVTCTTTSRFCPLWTGPSLNCLPQDSSVQGSAPPHVSSLPSTTPGFGMTESVFSTEWQHSALATESTKLVPTMTAEGMKPNVPEPSIARFSSSSESRLYLRVDER